MKLFVGLGNPGDKYARNRHNVGFMAAERIAARHGLGPWRSKFRGRLAEGALDGGRVLLLEPQTFMNESGRSVAEAVRFHKIAPADVIVLHDELDLAPSKVRVKLGGGVAGHNGLRSIAACLGVRDFRRVRIGIGHPGHKDQVTGHVLGDFAKVEQDWLQTMLDAIAEAAPLLARDDDSGFMNKVALLTQPPKPPRARAAPDGVA
ncbi:aminoacyl-tRNA hydrolase [Marinimicrococcus flavescens]|uniref:aminoacyl-tRNA hydrolase n=1 Tax=Marinimicrococcus flavescens TaxID=3031815 RepID=UPI002E19BC5F